MTEAQLEREGVVLDYCNQIHGESNPTHHTSLMTLNRSPSTKDLPRQGDGQTSIKRVPPPLLWHLCATTKPHPRFRAGLIQTHNQTLDRKVPSCTKSPYEPGVFVFSYTQTGAGATVRSTTALEGLKGPPLRTQTSQARGSWTTRARLACCSG